MYSTVYLAKDSEGRVSGVFNDLGPEGFKTLRNNGFTVCRVKTFGTVGDFIDVVTDADLSQISGWLCYEVPV